MCAQRCVDPLQTDVEISNAMWTNETRSLDLIPFPVQFSIKTGEGQPAPCIAGRPRGVAGASPGRRRGVPGASRFE